MANDPVKEKVAGLVQRLLTENLTDLIDTECGDDPHLGDQNNNFVEVQTVTPTQTMIRVKSGRRDGQPPRYFLMKLTEQM